MFKNSIKKISLLLCMLSIGKNNITAYEPTIIYFQAYKKTSTGFTPPIMIGLLRIDNPIVVTYNYEKNTIIITNNNNQVVKVLNNVNQYNHIDISMILDHKFIKSIPIYNKTNVVLNINPPNF